MREDKFVTVYDGPEHWERVFYGASPRPLRPPIPDDPAVFIEGQPLGCDPRITGDDLPVKEWR